MNKSHLGFPIGRALDTSLLGFPEHGGATLEAELRPPANDYTGWWDAAYRSTLKITSDAVEMWRDRSSNGYDLLQGISTQRPGFLNRQINNVVVPDFDGTDDFMVSHHPFMSRPSTGFMVIQADTVSAEQRLFDASPTANNLFWGIDATGVLVLNKAGGLARLGTHPLVLSRPYAVGWVVDLASTVGLYVNQNRRDVIADSQTGLDLLCVGARYPGNVGGVFNGAIAEILMYDGTALTHEQMVATLGYLREKWGLP